MTKSTLFDSFRRPEPPRFEVVSVTERAHEVILDLEAAYARLLAASEPEAIQEAYGALCQRRKDLYEHIQELERAAGKKLRPVTLRFD